MEDYPDVDSYLADSERWHDEIVALRPILQATGLDEEIKWGKPCYVHHGANIVIVQEFADNLALMFFKGILLDDPADLLQEVGPNSHAARRLMFSSLDDVDRLANTVTAYVKEAVAVEDAGTEVPPRPEESLAVELQERLAGSPELADAFDSLTPGRQREYNLHVSAAKQVATRERRIDTITPRILAGKGLRDR
ncbi:YdeI/OmpD-associated family protein [Euzebya tangerina]|uniref:YdeI/OmpD-associated family protein n=1 Tax=Euzebya tangerina TaxID=591198 RepID=UPI00196A950F|nr:YdeI/OmpD-associated family protein [Euzebya tangerina]